MELGYKLCSEEHGPNDLVRFAQRAEDSGFSFAMISDHFHPWIEEQGESPFVWAVIGAIASSTKTLRVGTGVTCPTLRILPPIIAQAAATAEALMPGRFMLGVGSGENLNEHIIGERWPPARIRQEMLEEAIEIIRLLWTGEQESYRGKYFTVENARVFSLPDQPPPIFVAAAGSSSANLAGRVGDGLIGTSPKKDTIDEFRAAGGERKPCYGEIAVCYASSKDEAKRIAYKCWPNVAITGELTQELPTPAHFQQAAKMLSEEQVAKEVVCGPDPEPLIERINKYAEAGYDHVWLHQIGPDQEGFFRFVEKNIINEFN